MLFPQLTTHSEVISNLITKSYFRLITTLGAAYPLDVFSILKGSATRLGSSSILQTSRRTYATGYVAWGLENLNFTTDNRVERPFKFAVSAIKTLVDAKK